MVKPFPPSVGIGLVGPLHPMQGLLDLQVERRSSGGKDSRQSYETP